MDTLTRDALTVLQPGFTGTTPPDWLLRRLGEGLAAVGLFGRNVVTPDQLAALTARLRAERDDVLVAIDEEGGDVTRLEVRTGSSFPGNLALGAVDDPELTRAVARELGRRLAECGINLNWAPSADVNSDPDNPVIGVRSFGADPELVARHTAAYVDGLQAAGVAACTKHFPGHGDTSVDSHDDMPRVGVDLPTLRARDLPPFHAAVAAGTKAVMSAHILLPALDPRLPATLSPDVLHGLLRAPVERGGLGFDGLIVTDGIEMRAISAAWGIERGGVLALAAGCDAICVGGGHSDEGTVLRLRDAIVAAVRSGELPEERLSDAATRVRALARWASKAREGAREGSAPTPDIGLTAARRALRLTRPSGPGTPGGRSDGQDHDGPVRDGPVRDGLVRNGLIRDGLVHDRPAHDGLVHNGPVIDGSVHDGPVHVAAYTPSANFAVGDETPWGVAADLARLLPGTSTGSYGPDTADADTVSRDAGGRPVVAVVRDVHRHPWMATALAALVAARPDTVVVEMGLPQAPPVGALHIATHGAARVCGTAAAEAIAGRVAD
ncbi:MULTISPECIES: glycoside hydrolase family 3 protein [Streptomyces]|uniref:glycoside hydrolase family 3 protein n=1 Tax=Streptomyces TaxID=1883 RepID=UPI00163D3153|nr:MULTISPECIES: glycoside hydrolase family 3 protein [Streptomyces]MBC2873583.1 glycoside hydrolase family 3 protein [Streptomyces sp. TYQ1024]UBI36880.1 glycoside hydrolase family 3 protein [Streptomyces mobaraensis]UKW29472.1 glycoside hydrolase family 3 protein [Streptomyces sp. TYQ1024]